MDDVLYEVRAGVARLTLNREASRNALSPAAIAAVGAHLDAAEADPDVRAVCLTGAGDKVFCSGADLGSAFAGGSGEAVPGPVAYARLLRRMLAFPKPLVARVNGHCLAGGLGLVLACDLAYAREDVRFGTPEVKVGLFPMMVAPLMLRSVPRKRALELMLTAEPIDGREAAAIGLVTRAVPAAGLDATVDKALAAVCANAPVAIRMGREAIGAVDGRPAAEVLETLAGRLADLLATEDAAEGLAAFLEKRAPQWKGR
ncbi:MAG: enoyl-CoA hydratase/isomerase family protein [Deltaproteobacteria bacterium]|nr:enoyl-CoA hydratase/isomerase family protein [Deltaproteobacteria bacterium]